MTSTLLASINLIASYHYFKVPHRRQSFSAVQGVRIFRKQEYVCESKLNLISCHVNNEKFIHICCPKNRVRE